MGGSRKSLGYTEEQRVTDPTTGAQKGTKLARHDLIPPEFLTELAEHFGKGASKYDENNWRKGYNWSLSYQALQRHLLAFWAGIDWDVPVEGLPPTKHIICAAWHCVVLSTFMDEFPEKDDRFNKRKMVKTTDVL